MVRVLVLFILGALSLATSVSVEALPIYRSGREVCALNASARDGELGFWVPSDGVQIYAWTNEPFDLHLKTLIFVSGGPGAHSHESRFRLPGWNVVFFDQRGISCSRPSSVDVFRDRRFYSSWHTARDIEAIRDFLKVDKVSVYGVSYGTVPAHLYGFLFPGSTRSLILEGVVARSDAKTLIENPHRIAMLQRFFDSLPLKHRLRILELSENENLPRTWFSQVGKMMFYLDQPELAYRNFLEATLWQDRALQTLIPGFADHVAAETEFGFSSMAMRMLSCQEMGLNSGGTSFVSEFRRAPGGLAGVGAETLRAESTAGPEASARLRAVRSDELRKEFCEPLGFRLADKGWLFKAEDYPLRVPVTYIQGLSDGATSPAQAIHSYRHAAMGWAQLVEVEDGGHQPVQGILQSGYGGGDGARARQTLVTAAAEGVAVDSRTLERLNHQTGMTWHSRTKLVK